MSSPSPGDSKSSIWPYLTLWSFGSQFLSATLDYVQGPFATKDSSFATAKLCMRITLQQGLIATHTA